MNDESLKILNSIAQTIFDKKGFNILVIDVRGISTLTDYLIIAEGTADRHVQAIASAVIKTLKDLHMSPVHVEGKNSGDWIVIDDLTVVTHLFMPGMRERYSLEELWRDGKIVNVTINTNKALNELKTRDIGDTNE